MHDRGSNPFALKAASGLLGATGGYRRKRRRCAFSLIELMIALTILGLGLVMVATLFPVAWTRARQLAEHTTQSAITENTGITMDLMMTVDGLETQEGSFAGDLIVDPVLGPLYEPDSRVHALNMENVLVSAPRGFTPDREDSLASTDARKNVGAPWRLEQLEVLGANLVPFTEWPAYIFTGAFGKPQVRFEQRVYPPLRARRSDSVTPPGEFLSDPGDPQWDEALDTRRFAWAVFHRLREPEVDPTSLPDFTNDEVSIAFLSQRRVFDVYYVTLRRTQPSYRYAQQDPDGTAVPFPETGVASPMRGEPTSPLALPADHDVLLPTPWRVQVYFPPDGLPSVEAPPNLGFDAPRGVPTEIQVNTDSAPTAAFVVDFFPPGASFIDEVNGLVYRVVRRRIAGELLDQAYMTVDREVLVEDIDDGHFDPDPAENHFGDWIIQDDESIRTVWVFPPPVQATRVGNGIPVFEGKQPVVGIELRTLTVSP